METFRLVTDTDTAETVDKPTQLVSLFVSNNDSTDSEASSKTAGDAASCRLMSATGMSRCTGILDILCSFTACFTAVFDVDFSTTRCPTRLGLSTGSWPIELLCTFFGVATAGFVALANTVFSSFFASKSLSLCNDEEEEDEEKENEEEEGEDEDCC